MLTEYKITVDAYNLAMTYGDYAAADVLMGELEALAQDADTARSQDEAAKGWRSVK
jgi:hypothetical protein